MPVATEIIHGGDPGKPDMGSNTVLTGVGAIFGFMAGLFRLKPCKKRSMRTLVQLELEPEPIGQPHGRSPDDAEQRLLDDEMEVCFFPLSFHYQSSQ